MSKPSVRETIAAARAKMAQEQAKSKTIRGGQEDEREAFIGTGKPGVKKSPPVARRQTEVEMLGHVQKSIKSLIANAKGTGKGDSSGGCFFLAGSDPLPEAHRLNTDASSRGTL